MSRLPDVRGGTRFLFADCARHVQHTLDGSSSHTYQSGAFDVPYLALVIVRKWQHILKMKAVLRPRFGALRCFREAENAGTPMRRGDDENTKLWDLSSVAMPIV